MAIRQMKPMSLKIEQDTEARVSRQIATILYWIGILLSLPFIVLFGASVMRMFSEGMEAKYVSSAFLGVVGAAFSYSVGYLLRHMLTQDNR